MRTTEKALQSKIDQLNKITGNPLKPYSYNEGTIKGNVGNYCLNGVYGGWNLVQIVNEGGGIHSLLFGRTKSELYSRIESLIMGVLIGKELHL